MAAFPHAKCDVVSGQENKKIDNALLAFLMC